MSKILSTLALISTLFAFDAKAEATNQLTLGTVVDSDNGSGSEDLYVSFVACHPATGARGALCRTREDENKNCGNRKRLSGLEIGAHSVRLTWRRRRRQA